MREQSKQILDQEHNTKLELRLSQAESESLLYSKLLSGIICIIN